MRDGARPFRLRFEKAPTAKATDLDPPGTTHYEGPFGPFQVSRGGLATTTVLTGPAVGSVELPWGSGARQDPDCAERLRAGLTVSAAGEQVRLHQPARGLWRRRRAIHVERPGHPPALLRLRRYNALVLERTEGTRLVEWRRVHPPADAVDVAIYVLVTISSLRSETTFG